MSERWHQTLKNHILLENYLLPGDLEAQIEALTEHYNHQRYHESLGNMTPDDTGGRLPRQGQCHPDRRSHEHRAVLHLGAGRGKCVPCPFAKVDKRQPPNQPLPTRHVAPHNDGMRIAIVDESASRAAVIHEGIAALDDCEIFVVTERRGLVARIGEIEPDIILMDLGNPSRDVLEEYFTVSRAVARPIAMFVDESDEESIAASIDAGVSAYVVDGLSAHRIRPLLDLAVRRFNAFSRLQADLAEAKGKLAERDSIDKAKRILMDSRGIPEHEAYGEMRRTAMSQGRRIADIAEAVITAHQLLGGK